MITVHGSGFNPNSILIQGQQQMMQQQQPSGMYNQPMQQPGCMMPIGTVGYNGGYPNMPPPQPQYTQGGVIQGMGNYYNPYAGGYYNPYMMAQQQKQQEALQRERDRQNSDMFKKMSRIADKASGGRGVDIETHVKRYDPVYQTYDDAYYEEQKVIRMYSTLANAVPTNNYAYISNFNREIDRVKEMYPDNMGLSDFFEESGQLGLDMAIAKSKEEQKNLGQLYNKNQYGELLDIHKKSSPFGSVFGNGANNGPITIDDMEVRLPEHLNTNYDERKKKFLESIFNK